MKNAKKNLHIALLFTTIFLMSTTAFATKRYWVGTGANKNWNATVNWSTASGGSSGSSVPVSFDSVCFDGNGTGQCNIDAAISVKAFEITPAYTDTVKQNSFSITVGTSGMTLSGGTFLGGSANINDQGVFTLSGCIFQSTSAVLLIQNNYTFSSGTFSHNNGEVKFIATSILSGNTNFYKLTFSPALTSTFTISSGITFTVNNELKTTGSSVLAINTGNIDAKGDVTILNTSNTTLSGGTGSITINGTGKQIFTGAATIGYGRLCDIKINKSTDTLVLKNIISLAGDWTYTQGIVDARTFNSTVAFVENSITNTLRTISGINGLNNVILTSPTTAGSYNDILLSDTLTVFGELKIEGAGAVRIFNGTIKLKGDLTITNSSMNATSTGLIIMCGTADQTITGTTIALQGRLCKLNIDKPSGTLILKNIISFADGAGLKLIRGTVDATTYSSTVIFTRSDITIRGKQTFHNLIFNNTGVTARVYIGVTDTLVVNNDLKIEGADPVLIYDGTINAKGNITITNTSTFYSGATANLNICGTGNQTLTGSGIINAGKLCKVTINKPSGTLSLSGIISLGNSWQYNTGTVSPGNSTVVFAASLNASCQGTGSPMDFNHVTVSNGTTTLTGNLSARGNLTINSGTTLNGNARNLNIGGNWDNSGTFNATNTNVTLSGSTQSITNGTFNNLEIAGTGIKSAANALTVNGLLTLNNAVTLDMQTYQLSGSTITSSGTGLLKTASANSTPIPSGKTWSFGIEYAGTSASSNVQTGAYSNLILSGSRETASVTFPNATVGISGVFTNSATFTSGGFITTGNDVDYNGTGAQTITPFNYNNLSISGIRTTNNVTLSTSGTIGIAGTFSNSASFTSGSIYNSGSTIALNGNTNQTISSPIFSHLKELILDKPAGQVTLGSSVTIDSLLTLTKGPIISDNSNLVIINNGATVSGASDLSYVSGPVTKIGNSAFVFPVGKSNNYQPISISAPSNSAAAFTAEYFHANAGLGMAKDSTIDSVSTCEYWTLNNVGTAYPVNVSLGWNSQSCAIATGTGNMRLTKWDGTKWSDLGNSSSTTGIVTSFSTISNFGTFSIAQKKCYATPGLVVSTDVTINFATSVPLTVSGASTYSWSPYTNLSSSTGSSVTAFPVTTTTFSVTGTTINGCQSTDSVIVSVHPMENMCDFDTIIKTQRLMDSTFQTKLDNVNSVLWNYIAAHSGHTPDPISLSYNHVIPVVVHIITDPSDPLPLPFVTYAQVESQINALNRDFANGSATPGATNTGIQFCLAPNSTGEPWTNLHEPGVMRWDDLTPNAEAAHNTLSITGTNALLDLTHTGMTGTGSSANFPFANYLNIWVVRDIDGDCSGTQGYAINPLGPSYGLAGYLIDGVVVREDAFGDNSPGNSFVLQPYGTPSSCPTSFALRNQGKILAHEVGHYLELWHTFQPTISTTCQCAGGTIADGFTDGDYCPDTPPCVYPPIGATNPGGCPTYTPSLTNTCTESNAPYGGSADENDQKENFMYYSFDDVWNTFTHDQSVRMDAYLVNFRPALISLQNQLNTGILGPNGCIPSQLFADFTFDATTLCINQNIIFESIPNPPNTATNYNWNFPGGTSASSTLANLVVSYATPGTYTITLTVDDGVNPAISHSETIAIGSCLLDPNYIHNAQWYFGQYATIDFTSGLPVPTDAARSAIPPTIFDMEGGYSYSDNTGRLVFYSDGVNLWDNTHTQVNVTPVFPSAASMLNSVSGLNQATTSVNGMTGIPFPGHPNEYFLFSAPAQEDNGVLNQVRFVQINLATSTITTAQLLPPIGAKAEGLTIIPHCNGQDYWLVTHNRSGTPGIFFVYLISSLGINQIPVISGGFSYYAGLASQMKGSPNNARIALICPVGNLATSDFAVYNFDNSTGVVAGELTFDAPGFSSFSGCSFSALSNQLYAACYGLPSSIFQVNLATSAVSQLSTPAGNTFTYMQLGPDDNIYVANGNLNSIPPHISCITNPDTPINTFGLVVNAVDFIIPATGIRPAIAVPQLLDGIMPVALVPDFSVNYNSCTGVTFTFDQCWSGYNYSWDFGDPSTGANNISLLQNPTHIYSGPGTYTVTCTLTIPGGTGNIQATQIITILNTTTPITGASSTCLNGTPPYIYSVPFISGSGATYDWTTSINGDIVSPDDISQINVNWTSGIIGTVNVAITNGGCVSNGTLNVTINPQPTITVNSPAICNGQTATLTASGAVSYTWSAGATSTGVNTATASPTVTTTYIVTGTDVNGCSSSANQIVNVFPGPPLTVTVPSDITVCAGATVAATNFGSTPAGATFDWTNSNPSIGLAASGTGDVPSFTATNTTGSAIAGTITVTPTLGCVGVPSSYTITINPIPNVIINTPLIRKLCSGEATGVALTGNVAGTTFAWSVSQTNVSGATSGNGNNINQTLFATSTIIGTAIYTITPSANSCIGAPISVAFTVKPVPVATATPTSQTICSITATSIALTSSINGTFFSWTVAQTNVSGATTGSGTTITQTLTATSQPLSGTAIYTITPITKGCPGAPITVPITVTPLPIVTVNSPTICLGDIATLTAGGATTYSWSTGATNTNTINVSPTINTNYTVTGTTSGCSNTAIAAVNVGGLNCCSFAVGGVGSPIIVPSAGLTITGGSYISKNFKVNGDITITGNVTFRGCDMQMGARVKIIVQAGAILTIINSKRTSHLYACGDMWNGIYVETGGTLKVIGKTKIEDGLMGVFAKVNATLTVDQSIFNRNLKHIVIGEKRTQNNQIWGISPISITGTSFTCTSNMNSPNSTLRTNVGIEIFNRTNITIGAPAGTTFPNTNTNTFSNMDYGILALTEYKVIILNNDFLGLTNTSTAIINDPRFSSGIAPPPGIGIYVEFSQIFIGDLSQGIPAKNRFRECYRGIDMYLPNAGSVEGNQFMNASNSNTSNVGNHAIFIKSPIYDLALLAKNNEIVNFLQGIHILANNGDGQLYINGNTISATATGVLENGVFVELVNYFTREVSIENNTITGAGISCIRAKNIVGIPHNLVINANQNLTTRYAASGNAASIRVEGGSGSIITGNNFINSNNSIFTIGSNTGNKGIHMSLSPFATLTCNQVSNVGQGLVFEGLMGGTMVSSNQMQNAVDGFVLLNSGIIGAQGSNGAPSDNQWVGGASTFARSQTYTDGTSGANTDSPIWVRPGTDFLPTLNLTNLPFQAISPNQSATNPIVTACPTPSCQTCNVVFTRSMLADSTLSDSSCLTCTDDFVLRVIEDSISYPVNPAENKWLGKHAVFEKLKNDPHLQNGQANVLEFYNQTALENIGKLSSVNERIAQNDYAVALSENTAIVPENNLEANQQAYNDLYIKTMGMNMPVTTSQINTLESLSVLCPFTEGTAVYQSQSLLNLIKDDVVEYVCNCNESSRMHSTTNLGSVKPKLSNEFSLFPNPTSNNIELVYNINENAKFILFDLYGKVLKTIELNPENTKERLSLIDLPNGVYLYKVLINNKLIKTDKLVLIK